MHDTPPDHRKPQTDLASRARAALAAFGLAATVTLAGCATETPYQPISSPRSAQGGYSEHEIAPNYWSVTFSGNSLTSRETVEGYLLYRAAELTLQQHDDWFQIVNRELEHNVTQEPGPGLYQPWWGYPGWRPYWRYYGRPYGWRAWDPFWDEPFFDSQQVERYEATAEIQMYRGSPSQNDRNAFVARDVISRLEPQIKRPQ